VPRHSEVTLAAIKHAVDIVALVGEYLPLTRAGSKFKALCPFHDDHNPSLELNSDRQSYKCWSCGAGGDVFDFVKEYERVDFPEALRMLAERAGVALDSPTAGTSAPRGPSKSELLAVHAWAEGAFREALGRSEPAKAYLAERGINAASVARFKLGYAPGDRGWLLPRAKRAGFPVDLLERSGLVSRPQDAPAPVQFRERFRGRLMFPIHDFRGQTIGFGGRVLPEVEHYLAASGKRVAKYLNSPETPLFQKRRVLYASHLARAAAREAGWVAVVEGYTDVIAAHQVGLPNVVGTLGTALGDDHVTALKRLAAQVVLIFDGDDAGQNAADRALELFLGHEVDVRVLTLPDDLDPCDFLLAEGADAFRALVDKAVDPLAFALRRAEARFDLNGLEGSRQAAEWVLNILGRVPTSQRVGLDVKVAKALDTLAQRLRVPVETLDRRLRAIRRNNRNTPARIWTAPPTPTAPATDNHPDTQSTNTSTNAPNTTPTPSAPSAAPVMLLRTADLDATDRELVQIVLNEPALVGRVITRVTAGALRDAPLRALLQTAYDLHSEGITPSFERIAMRVDDPALRAFAAGLLLPIDPAPLPDDVRPAPWEDRLRKVLTTLDERDRLDHLRELKGALDETNESADPVAYRALKTEYLRLLTQRPDTKTKTAS
jgi:DNA primase